MLNLYGNKWIGYGYDLLASLVWLPSKNKLYDQCVTLLNIQKDDTVLELGCGTGFLTQKLVSKQAIVTAIDQSTSMLARAKKRVAQVKFIQCDILQYTHNQKYDFVVLFFVLHELNAAERTTLLQSAKGFLNKEGEIIICDFSIPDKEIMKTVFPKLLRLWESRNTINGFKNGFYSEITSNNLAIKSHVKLHQGRVQLIKLKPI